MSIRGESKGSELRRWCSAISISPSVDSVLPIFRGIDRVCVLFVVSCREFGEVFLLPARNGSLDVAVVVASAAAASSGGGGWSSMSEEARGGEVVNLLLYKISPFCHVE